MLHPSVHHRDDLPPQALHLWRAEVVGALQRLDVGQRAVQTVRLRVVEVLLGAHLVDERLLRVLQLGDVAIEALGEAAGGFVVPLGSVSEKWLVQVLIRGRRKSDF